MKIFLAIIISAVIFTACGRDGGEKVVTHPAATMTGEGIMIEETD